MFVVLLRTSGIWFWRDGGTDISKMQEGAGGCVPTSWHRSRRSWASLWPSRWIGGGSARYRSLDLDRFYPPNGALPPPTRGAWLQHRKQGTS